MCFRTTLGELRTIARLNVVEKLSVNVPVGTNFIDEYFISTYQSKRKPTRLESRPISVHIKRALDKVAIVDGSISKGNKCRGNNNNNRDKLENNVKLRFERQTSIKP